VSLFRVIISCAVIIVTARCGRDLSRSAALEALRKRPPEVLTATLKAPLVFPNDGSTGLATAESYAGTQPYQQLVERGVLEVRTVGCSAWYFRGTCGVIALTPEGKRLAKSWTATFKNRVSQTIEDQYATEVTWEVPVAHSEVFRVTGVSLSEGGTEADVEYVWRWKPSQFAYFAAPPVDHAEQRATAQFRRFDDGWRLE
jgi:hypothetical protein